MQLPDTFLAARYRLGRRYPFLASALYAMNPRVTTACPTMSVDQHWRLYMNPEFVACLTVPEVEAVLYHEVLHLLFDHHGRSEAMGADQKLYNIAADLEINDNIVAEGLDLPEMALQAEDFGLERGLLAEEYYRKLLKQVREAIVELTGEPHPLRGQDGSGAGGEAQPWEEPGQGKDGVSKASGEVIRQHTAEQVAEATSSGKHAGSVPGDLERWAKTRLNPKIDWRRYLRARLRQAMAWSSGMTDYRYDRPSRRQSALPAIVLPRLISPMPSVAILVDTSGSMGNEELAQAMAEVGGVLRATNTAVDVYSGDIGVQTVSRVLRPEQVTLAGGGGTDMGLGLVEIAKTGRRYSLVVVLTDGYTPWTERKPGPWPVLVVLLGNGPEAPSWANSVRVQLS